MSEHAANMLNEPSDHQAHSTISPPPPLRPRLHTPIQPSSLNFSFSIPIISPLINSFAALFSKPLIAPSEASTPDILQPSTSSFSITDSSHPSNAIEGITSDISDHSQTPSSPTSANIATTTATLHTLSQKRVSLVHVSNQEQPHSIISSHFTPPLLMVPAELSESAMPSNETSQNKAVHNYRNSSFEIITEDPSCLFWVPAHQHPEIAPNEYLELLSRINKTQSEPLAPCNSPTDPHMQLDVEKMVQTRLKRQESIVRRHLPSESALAFVMSDFHAEPVHGDLSFNDHSDPAFSHQAQELRLKRSKRTRIRKGDRRPSTSSLSSSESALESPSPSNDSKLDAAPEVSPITPVGPATNLTGSSDIDEDNLNDPQTTEITCKASKRFSSLILNHTINPWTLQLNEENRKPLSMWRWLFRPFRGTSRPLAIRRASCYENIVVESDISINRRSPSSATLASDAFSQHENDTYSSSEDSLPDDRSFITLQDHAPSTFPTSARRRSLFALFGRSSNPLVEPENHSASDSSDCESTANSTHGSIHPSIQMKLFQLSHEKLASPQRPLHQQVLISNIIFMYMTKMQNQDEAQLRLARKDTLRRRENAELHVGKKQRRGGKRRQRTRKSHAKQQLQAMSPYKHQSSSPSWAESDEIVDRGAAIASVVEGTSQSTSEQSFVSNEMSRFSEEDDDMPLAMILKK